MSPFAVHRITMQYSKIMLFLFHCTIHHAMYFMPKTWVKYLTPASQRMFAVQSKMQRNSLQRNTLLCTKKYTAMYKEIQCYVQRNTPTIRENYQLVLVSHDHQVQDSKLRPYKHNSDVLLRADCVITVTLAVISYRWLLQQQQQITP